MSRSEDVIRRAQASAQRAREVLRASSSATHAAQNSMAPHVTIASAPPGYTSSAMSASVRTNSVPTMTPPPPAYTRSNPPPPSPAPRESNTLLRSEYLPLDLRTAVEHTTSLLLEQDRARQFMGMRPDGSFSDTVAVAHSKQKARAALDKLAAESTLQPLPLDQIQHQLQQSRTLLAQAEALGSGVRHSQSSRPEESPEHSNENQLSNSHAKHPDRWLDPQGAAKSIASQLQSVRSAKFTPQAQDTTDRLTATQGQISDGSVSSSVRRLSTVSDFDNGRPARSPVLQHHLNPTIQNASEADKGPHIEQQQKLSLVPSNEDFPMRTPAPSTVSSKNKTWKEEMLASTLSRSISSAPEILPPSKPNSNLNRPVRLPAEDSPPPVSPSRRTFAPMPSAAKGESSRRRLTQSLRRLAEEVDAKSQPDDRGHVRGQQWSDHLQSLSGELKMWCVFGT